MNDRKFNRYLELPEVPRMIDMFLNTGEERRYAKEEYLLREGQTSDRIGFVKDGGFRQTVRREDGTERIVGYSFTGDFAASLYTLQTGLPSPVSIQAIRDSTVFMLGREEMQSHQSLEFRLQVAEVVLGDTYDRLLSWYRDTPGERYRKLVLRYPAILNEVSLKEIASFIGITPETLSRIRKKILLLENS